MNIAKRISLILFVLVTCVGCDQSSKTYAELNLPKVTALTYLSDTVRLQVAHNEGAFLGLGASAPKAWRLTALRLGVSAGLLALFAYVMFSNTVQVTSILALSLILAGGIGNLIDRFTHGGYVVDFINLGVGPLRTGIFNVADIAITVGVFLLFIHSRRTQINRWKI